jgi:glycosyltransferase involved in cell wall biosynthesis
MKNIFHYGNARWLPGRLGNSAQQLSRACLRQGIRVCYFSPSDRNSSRLGNPFSLISKSDSSPGDLLPEMIRRWDCSVEDTVLFISYATETARHLHRWFTEAGFPTVYRHVDYFQNDIHQDYSQHAADEICLGSDLVTVSHPKLNTQIPSGCQVHTVHNGLDSVFFHSDRHVAATSTGLVRKGEVTLGFWGTDWGKRLDWKLLESLALRHPTWAVNLLVEESGRLPSNVNVIGHQHPRLLPSILKDFDVCLVPYRTDQLFASYSNPLKVLEYLSGGKPVVSPPNSSLSKYPGVFFYDGLDQITETVQRALQQTEQDDRLAQFAQKNSWEERTSRLLTLVAERTAAKTAS